jgi:hypothetical protein
MRRKQRPGQSGTAALHTVPLDRAQAGEQLSADLRVRTPVAGEPGGLRLLHDELVDPLDAAFAHCLASGQQLTPGPCWDMSSGGRGGHLAVFGIILVRMGCLTG